MINKEAYRKPQKDSRKPKGSYKNFQGRFLTIFSLLFWKIDVLILIFNLMQILASPLGRYCPQFFGMMTAFTDTSSPELPYSLNLFQAKPHT